jgi:hypothetical protein
MFITVLKQPIICLCSEPDQSSPRPPANSSMIHFNITLPSAPRSFKSKFYFMGTRQKSVHNSPHHTRVTCPAHLILLDWAPK